MLALQSGPTPDSLEIIPLTVEEADASVSIIVTMTLALAVSRDTIMTFYQRLSLQSLWNQHECFPNMGYHYFSFQTDASDTCGAETVTLQIVYYYGQLNGFVFQTFAYLEGTK